MSLATFPPELLRLIGIHLSHGLPLRFLASLVRISRYLYRAYNTLLYDALMRSDQLLGPSLGRRQGKHTRHLSSRRTTWRRR